MKNKVDVSFQGHKTSPGKVQQPSGETFVIQIFWQGKNFNIKLLNKEKRKASKVSFVER